MELDLQSLFGLHVILSHKFEPKVESSNTVHSLILSYENLKLPLTAMAGFYHCKSSHWAFGAENRLQKLNTTFNCHSKVYLFLTHCAAYIGIGGMKIENEPRH
jgi:hypothetical protein